jgi:lipoate-protein ligase A
MKVNNISKVYEMSPEEIKEIQKLVDEKYTTWEWIYGNSPKYSFDNTKRFAGGTVEFNMEVDKGIIKAIRIYGDFFGERDINELEVALTGVKHSEEEIVKALEGFEIGKYIANVTLEDILSGLF